MIKNEYIQEPRFNSYQSDKELIAMIKQISLRTYGSP